MPLKSMSALQGVKSGPHVDDKLMFFMSTSSRTPPLLTPPLTSLEVSKLHGVTAFSEEQEDVDEVWCARHHVAQHGLEISIKSMS